MQMAKSFKIVTCADSGFYKFLPSLEKNIKRKFGSYPVIYDLGLTKKQIISLKSTVISITPTDGYNNNSGNGHIRAIHKPTCLQDAMNRFSDDILYVDADVLFLETIEASTFIDADVMVTPRHPIELKISNPFLNGKINSGVIFFKHAPQTQKLIDHWIEECANGDKTDQQALSDLLIDYDLSGDLGVIEKNGLRVLKLDAQIYNDVGCYTGKVFHFKNSGRRSNRMRRRTKYALAEMLAPTILRRIVRRRRIYAMMPRQ